MATGTNAQVTVKFGRTVFVNLVVAERGLVLSKAKAPQPNHDVHDGGRASPWTISSPAGLGEVWGGVGVRRRARSRYRFWYGAVLVFLIGCHVCASSVWPFSSEPWSPQRKHRRVGTKGGLKEVNVRPHLFAGVVSRLTAWPQGPKCTRWKIVCRGPPPQRSLQKFFLPVNHSGDLTGTMSQDANAGKDKISRSS
jgi:hypothetical protein